MKKLFGIVAVLSLMICIAVGAALLSPKAHNVPTTAYPVGHCVIDITHGETDGVPVTCMNTHKIATQADYGTACYWNGSSVVGLTIYNTSINSFSATTCGAQIFPIPAYASHWRDVIFTSDGKQITHAAYAGDSWVVVFGNGATYAGVSPDMVSYLRDIQSAEILASLGQAGGYPSSTGSK